MNEFLIGTLPSLFDAGPEGAPTPEPPAPENTPEQAVQDAPAGASAAPPPALEPAQPCDATRAEKGEIVYGVHQFRHLNASLLIYNGEDVRAVSAALGHSQTSTTLNIYAHTFETAQARACDALAEALPMRFGRKRV